MEFDKYKSLKEIYSGRTLDIILFGSEEIENGQLGYAVSKDGLPLYGENEGQWKKEWYVIGYESGCGDPIFIDTNQEILPVYTAAHGSGAWKKSLMAESIEMFKDVLAGKHAHNKENIWKFYF
ncbi:MAG: hypothetical protein K6L80_15555 [Agarilytica sp.]